LDFNRKNIHLQVTYLEVSMSDERKPPTSERNLPTPGRSGIEPLLDSHKAAAMLDVHPRTLQRMVLRGQIAGVQVGKLWRFRASAIDQWIDRKQAS
jgi:excisionase family DNA binding protein